MHQILKSIKFWQAFLCSLGYGVASKLSMHYSGKYFENFASEPLSTIISFTLIVISILVVVFFISFGAIISINGFKATMFTRVYFGTLVALIVTSTVCSPFIAVFSYNNCLWWFFSCVSYMLAGTSIVFAIITTLKVRLKMRKFLLCVIVSSILSFILFITAINGKIKLSIFEEPYFWSILSSGAYLWISAIVAVFIASELKLKEETET